MRSIIARTRLTIALAAIGILSLTSTASAQDETTKTNEKGPPHATELKAPVRLQADGRAIDIGEKSSIAHAGPVVADVDNDGDRDLLVGDFPGYFWFYENTGTDKDPVYKSGEKFQAGDEDAKTPVY